MENNKRIAQAFRQIAALLDEQGVAFKPAAYRKAATTVEEYAGDICSIKEVKELRKLSGIGEATAGKIREFCDTGRMKHLEELMAAQGGLSAALMEIEGLGPKRVRVLQKELGISTVEQLVEAATKGKLNGLPGFSDVMEKKILENAGRVNERLRRFTIEEVTLDVERILAAIRKVKGVERCEPAGSYRRGKATVGDVDIAVVTKNPKDVSEAVGKLPIVRNVVAQGDTKISFDVVLRSKEALRVDVRFVTADQWGSALLYFTGDKEHNIALRKIAIGKGWKLNEYGLFEGEKVLASKEEVDIYRALGLPWIEPKERTGRLPDVLPF